MLFLRTYQNLLESYRNSIQSDSDYDSDVESDIHHLLLQHEFKNEGGDDYQYDGLGGEMTLTVYPHNRIVHCDVKIQFNVNMDGMDKHEIRRIKIHLTGEQVDVFGEDAELEVFHDETGSKLVVHLTIELDDLSIEKLEEMLRTTSPEEVLLNIKRKINEKIGDILNRGGSHDNL